MQSQQVAVPDRALSDLFAADDDPWVVVDQMLYAGSAHVFEGSDRVFKTHYFCRACCGELTDLRVHYVVCCPYCGTSLPFLLDDREREHVRWDGDWPYHMLRTRFVSWCRWVGVPEGTPPTILPNGNHSWVTEPCRLLENHAGGHRFIGEKQRPPLNPIREWLEAR